MYLLYVKTLHLHLSHVTSYIRVSLGYLHLETAVMTTYCHDLVTDFATRVQVCDYCPISMMIIPNSYQACYYNELTIQIG